MHANGTLWLTNVTLQNGRADFDAATYHEHGGAIHNHGYLTLDRVAVITSSSTGSSHAWGGGGITNAGEARLSNVTVARNSTDAQGGGIENRGDTPVAERDGHRELRASKEGRRNLLRPGPNVQMFTADTIVALNRPGADCSGVQKMVSSGPTSGTTTPAALASSDRREGQARVRSQRLRPRRCSPAASKSRAININLICQYNDIRSVLHPQDGNGDGIVRCDSG